MGFWENLILKIFKVALYGDSLACPRHGVLKSHERYIALIETFFRSKLFDFFEIRDKATGGVTLPQLYGQYCQDNTYFSLPGDVLIIHSGIVDCAPRPISESMRAKISMLPPFIRNIIISYIHKNRSRLILKGKKIVKTNKVTFINTLDSFLESAISNYKKVLIVNICPTTDEFERRSPGLTDSINLYNNLISDIIKKKDSPKVLLIDIYKEISNNKNNIEDYIVKEDGHHIRPVTHKIIAEKIIECCKDLFWCQIPYIIWINLRNLW